MNESIVVGQGNYRGLTLWYNGRENKHHYSMKIWKNFKGFSFCELDENEKRVSYSYHYFSVSAWDYNTAFVYLRDHFNLVKG